jgi:pimeloyl-ACP methyl ester carboxylesterase
MELVRVGDAELEVERRGAGRPLLLLPGEDVLEPGAPFAAELAKKFTLIIPSPPGFGRSSRPPWVTSVDDISYLYLSLLERLDLREVAVLGCSLGGWIAAEMAVKDQSRLSRLALAAPYGIKLGGPAARDIADIWSLSPRQVAALKWHDPAKGERDLSAASDDDLGIIARNRESFARFCWEPYMHNPKLAHRLGRIRVPTLLLWGDKDGIVGTDYAKGFSTLIAGAELAIIPEAGHYPQLERPEPFLRRLGAFLG